MKTMVQPSAGRGALRPLDSGGVHVTDGFWAERLRTNREVTIPHGHAMLESSGALGNFRHAARGSGTYVGGLDDAGITFPFLDSDVYKWLEAVGWELGRAGDAELSSRADEVIDLVASAQRSDGYLNTFVQLSGRQPYTDLQWGHELYCIGHLTQAAVAWQRALGDERLTAVADRAIGHIEGALGADGQEGVDGHPEIEMALVELFRVTGEERYLRFAQLLVERRGRGLLGVGRLGARYWQDHLPVREAPTMTGHAVRQLYLDCGVVDVAVETGDEELLVAVVGRWEDMWATRTYLTGALGSRHRDEAFGDAFELPPDRAYAETCAAIASVMLAWRLLLATGEARFGDAVERTLYNGVLPGLSLDGSHFFYTNPLQLRDRPEISGAARPGRASWYPCACCPPNLMRTLSSFEQLLATSDEGGIQLQQYAGATISAPVAGGHARLRVESGYPWHGDVTVHVEETADETWRLRLRVPAWARTASFEVDGEGRDLVPEAGWVMIERRWRPGDRAVLKLAMPVRMTMPDPRIDAVRGCVALERGPLVYCLEQVDLPAGVPLADVSLTRDAAESAGLVTAQELPGVTVIEPSGQAHTRDAGAHGWPYGDTADLTEGPTPASLDLVAVPYFAWANRGAGAMRVWVPRVLGDGGEPGSGAGDA